MVCQLLKWWIIFNIWLDLFKLGDKEQDSWDFYLILEFTNIIHQYYKPQWYHIDIDHVMCAYHVITFVYYHILGIIVQQFEWLLLARVF